MKKVMSLLKNKAFQRKEGTKNQELCLIFQTEHLALPANVTFI